MKKLFLILACCVSFSARSDVNTVFGPGLSTYLKNYLSAPPLAIGSVTPALGLYTSGFVSGTNFYNQAFISSLFFVGNTVEISSNSITTAAWGGTTFTVAGCGTAASVTGHGTAGTFTVGTGAGTCTFVFTINGATGITAPHGWIANVDDVTAKQHCFNNGTIASTTTATVICNAAVTTGDLITFSAEAF